MTTHGKLAVLPLALPERPADRAFTLQYTTLILIIITFIVGSFGGRRIAQKAEISPNLAHPKLEAAAAPAEQPRPAVIKTAPEREPIDAISIEDLFKPASVELDTEKAFAIAAVLRNHDIDAEIDVVADSMGDDDYRYALRQARAVQRYLASAGVPGSAARVFVVDSRIPAWAAADVAHRTAVRFYRSRGDDGHRN